MLLFFVNYMQFTHTRRPIRPKPLIPNPISVIVELLWFLSKQSLCPIRVHEKIQVCVKAKKVPEGFSKAKDICGDVKNLFSTYGRKTCILMPNRWFPSFQPIKIRHWFWRLLTISWKPFVCGHKQPEEKIPTSN